MPGGGVGSAPLLQRAGHHAQLRLVVRPVISARIYKKLADFAVPKKGVKIFLYKKNSAGILNKVFQNCCNLVPTNASTMLNILCWVPFFSQQVQGWQPCLNQRPLTSCYSILPYLAASSLATLSVISRSRPSAPFSRSTSWPYSWPATYRYNR